MKNDKIDFVILWVDGSDKKWLEEKKNYKSDINVDDAINRYRDYGILKYWFRGVEKFAPWVNNVYFITYGHLPSFLNTKNPKLKIINHKDFIDKKALPTYNSNSIELSLINVKELSDKFVLFNDDMFLIKPVSKDDFFINDLPRDDYAETIISPNNSLIQYSLLNNANVINKHYNKRSIYKRRPFKYFNFKYGINNLKTLLLLQYDRFAGFYYNHMPQSFLKSYFKKLWDIEPELCKETVYSRFRSKNDITQWLIKELQMLDGNFVPRSHNFGHYYDLSNDNSELCSGIIKQKYKSICINDADENVDFNKCQKELINAFEAILPDKSSFERDE